MCREVIRVTQLEVRPNSSGRVRCSGTIRGAYLHAKTSRRIIAGLTNSLNYGMIINIELVKGAVVKVY